jgi:hypothetical protein
METIVLGVDGWASAHAAVAEAANEAALRGARLRLVCVWEVPPAAFAGGFAPSLDESAIEGLWEHSAFVERTRSREARRRQPEVPGEGAVEGQPTDVLQHESQEVSPIVVGLVVRPVEP